MKKTKAFTLIEVLIVMGILIILIGLSVAVGRWAIRRSNEIQHRSAAQQLEKALLRYKNENKYVPKRNQGGRDFFAEALGYSGTDPMLKEYLEVIPFDGGTDATYYYATDDLGQYFVVCVSFGGLNDENHRGYYCTGTGIGFVPEGNPITKQEIDPEPDDLEQRAAINEGMNNSDWLKDGAFARTGN
jgi:type II secretory pathway pseudopilin PulG